MENNKPGVRLGPLVPSEHHSGMVKQRTSDRHTARSGPPSLAYNLRLPSAARDNIVDSSRGA